MAERTDAEQVDAELQDIEDQLDELKHEKSKLLEANRMLVELVEKLEDELAGYVDENLTFDVQDHEYSFQNGWQSSTETHTERLELEPESNVEVEDVQDQIGEVRQSMQRLRDE